MSQVSSFDEDDAGIPPLKFELGLEGREAELLTRFIWGRIVLLIECGKEPEAAALLEEFDEPSPVWTFEAAKKKPRRGLRGLKSFRLIPITRLDATKLALLNAFVPQEHNFNCVMRVQTGPIDTTCGG